MNSRKHFSGSAIILVPTVINFNQFQSVWLGQKRRILLTTGRWGNQHVPPGMVASFSGEHALSLSQCRHLFISHISFSKMNSKRCVSKQCPADGVWRIGRGVSPDRVRKTRLTPSESSAGHGSPPQRTPKQCPANGIQRNCDGLFPDTVGWTRLRNTW